MYMYWVWASKKIKIMNKLEKKQKLAFMSALSIKLMAIVALFNVVSCGCNGQQPNPGAQQGEGDGDKTIEISGNDVTGTAGSDHGSLKFTIENKEDKEIALDKCFLVIKITQEVNTAGQAGCLEIKGVKNSVGISNIALDQASNKDLYVKASMIDVVGDKMNAKESKEIELSLTKVDKARYNNIQFEISLQKGTKDIGSKKKLTYTLS